MGFHGSLRGVLNVLRSVMALKEGFYVFQCYRGKVMPFDAGVIVPSVYFAIVNDLVAMQMTMHVAPVVSRKARWMHWHMREDKTASHSGITRMKERSPYVFKILGPF